MDRVEEERALHGSKSFDPALEAERERVDAIYAERLKPLLTKLERLRQGDTKEAQESRSRRMTLKRQELPQETRDKLWNSVDRYEQVLSAIGIELTDDGRVVAEQEKPWDIFYKVTRGES